MRMLCRVALLSLFFLQLIHAQPEIAAKFEACLLTHPGGTLSYWLFTPEGYDSTRHYPLVLALHGMGGQNTVLTYGRLATFWADPINQVQHPSFVAVPICPDGWNWPMMGTAVGALLDSLALAYSIDTDRLYVTGLSLGGNGTWDLLTRFPGRFAAVAPAAGWGVPSAVGLFANTPIWNFHGALDSAVPVGRSRDMITAMEAQGRKVVFTDCLGNDQKSIPDSVIAMHVAAHADVFYTEVATGMHDFEFFDFVYNNHKYLLSWMFDKHLLIPGAVMLTSPASYQKLSGAVPITWTGGASTDSVQIWFSPDEGRTWRLIEGSLPNSGSYLWATGNLEDCGLGLVKIFLKDPDGHIYSSDQSALFALDNAGDGLPSVSILRHQQLIPVYPNTWTDDTVTVAFHASDPEGSPLQVSMLYSADHGVTFTEIDSFTVASNSLPQRRLVQLGRGVNSQQAVLGVRVSDGLLSSMDVTRAFAKATKTSVARLEIPLSFRLEQNYPNPFNPTTTIQYALPHRYHVSLTVFNTLGQQVAQLVNGDIDAGYHSVQFDGSGLASGVYFYRLQAGSFVDTKKLLLVK